MVKVYYSLYDRLLSRERLESGFKKVKAAKGGPGQDGESIKAFTEKKDENLNQLLEELRTKTYRPQPVLRKCIRKDNGGIRELGVPAIRDRIVQQVLLDILQPIFEPDFHPSSYAYRKGRSCQDAIVKTTMYIRKYEFKWVVDMDLSKCFDRLDHDLILGTIRKRVTDGSILYLIKSFLISGVMVGGNWQASDIGSPQGGVISPLISNIYLNEFDQEMKARNFRIVRYADDIVILSRSYSAARNAQKRAVEILEGELKLKINREKTKLLNADEGIPYLGVVIKTNYTSIQENRIKRLKAKVKALTGSRSAGNLVEMIKRLNPVIRGFTNYFKIANCKGILGDMMSWIRRRLRRRQLEMWKRPKRLHRRLRQLGYGGPFKSIRMKSWRSACSPLVHMALPNEEFTRLGLFDMKSVVFGTPDWVRTS